MGFTNILRLGVVISVYCDDLSVPVLLSLGIEFNIANADFHSHDRVARRKVS
jgi:hypothetical protein